MGSRPHAKIMLTRTSNFSTMWLMRLIVLCVAISSVSVYASTLKHKLDDDTDIIFDDMQSTNRDTTPSHTILISEPAKFDDINSDEDEQIVNTPADFPAIAGSHRDRNVFGGEDSSEFDDDDTDELHPATVVGRNDLNVEDDGSWLMQGVRRLKREVNRLLGGSEEVKRSTPTVKAKTAKKGRGKKKVGKKAASATNNRKTATEKKHQLRRTLPEVRPKRQWDETGSDDEDFNGVQSGDGATDSGEQLYRLTFYIEEGWNPDFADRSSSSFIQLAESLSRGIQELFTRPDGTSIDAEVISVTQEDPIENAFKILVTTDIRLNPEAVRPDEVKHVIQDHITNYRRIGEYTVPLPSITFEHLDESSQPGGTSDADRGAPNGREDAGHPGVEEPTYETGPTHDTGSQPDYDSNNSFGTHTQNGHGEEGRPESVDHERNYGTELDCNNYEFACSDGSQCIPLDRKCDNYIDCNDKSDEQNCDQPQPPERPEYPIDPNQTDREHGAPEPDHPEQPEQTDQEHGPYEPEQPDHPEQTDQDHRPYEPEQPDHPEQTDQEHGAYEPDHPERTDQEHGSYEPDHPERTDQEHGTYAPERPDYPEQTDHPEQTDEQERPEGPSPPDQPSYGQPDVTSESPAPPSSSSSSSTVNGEYGPHSELPSPTGGASSDLDVDNDDYGTTPTFDEYPDINIEPVAHKETTWVTGTSNINDSAKLKCGGGDIYVCRHSGVEICRVQRCDGYHDCPDGEDEQNCARVCDTDEIPCDGTRCILKSRVCDGNPDCSDGTDETGCPTECSASEYRCIDGGPCIPLDLRCEGHIDCPAGDDEENCPAECTEHLCKDGITCIRRDQVCDRRTDCPQRDDEENCETESGCGENEFQCDQSLCIPEEDRCNGIRNCADFADESNCTSCQISAFHCNDNTCISENARCDGRNDCIDGSDEENCVGCPSDQFRCNDGLCLDLRRVCDGRPQCPDGSDEENCPTDESPPITSDDCNFDEFFCDDSCHSRGILCNGIVDCLDRKDEENCIQSTIPTYPSKPQTTYPCPELTCPGTGKCFSYAERCDTIRDCDDGYDESECCSESQFKCNDGSCLDQSAVCNGRRDCADGADEINCPTDQDINRIPPPPPSSGSRCTTRQWECANGQCINIHSHCDGRPDCADYSDERDCRQTAPPPGGDAQLDLKTYPNDQIIKESREVVFRCRDEGPSRARVRWTRPNGQRLPPGAIDTNGRLEIPNIQVGDSGEYICEAVGHPQHAQGQRVSVHLTVERYVTPRPAAACAYNQATCMNGNCIGKDQICDGIAHCADGSDEHACSRGSRCNPDQFLCKNTKCVDRLWRCDGEDDCGDRSDEESCDPNPTGSPCRYDEFQCQSGQCVPKSFHCDGRSDCSDGSDEIGCIEPTIVLEPPPLISVPVGGIFNITCRAIGVPTPLVLFRLNWGHIPDNCITTNSEGVGYLECRDMQIQHAGAYSCEAINIKKRIFAPHDAIVTIITGDNICPAGMFNSLANREEECINCFCFGAAQQCKSADLFTYALPPPIQTHNIVGLDIQQGGVGDYTVGEYPGQNLITLQHGIQFRASNIPYTRNLAYLSLPADYQGSQLKSYGGYIKYDAQYIGSGQSNNAPDIVVIGNGYTLVHRSAYPIRPNTVNRISVQFSSGPWYLSNGQLASREHIMMTLADVQYILIRLQYIDMPEREVEITNISMDSAAVDDRGLGSASLVEQCACPPGYMGNSCEKCGPGFIRRQTGRWLGTCVPEEPEICSEGTYGNPSRGIPCRPCPCPHQSGSGNYFARGCSLGADNEPICHCLPGYVGRRCEQCSAGFEGNPIQPGGQCAPIQRPFCDPRGTLNVGPDGSCQCKSNSVGQYCDQCAANSFHLNNQTQTGCIDCFCMGVTKECSSSSLYRDSVRSRLYGGNGHGFSLITKYEEAQPMQSIYGISQQGRELSFRGSYEDHDVQFWSLPSEFLGNQLASYGGYLRYTVRYNPHESGAMSRNSAPDVVIKSSNDIVIVHYRKDGVLPTGPQSYNVPIWEDSWQRLDGNTVNREHLLMALADVSAIFIKGTYTTVTEEAAISEVSLDSAVPRNTGNSRAVEVEECSCPPGHMGLSCETCSPGYKRSDEGLYLGICEPCECNGHSDECDPDSGVCQHCRDNTVGDNCEQCAPGFTGDAQAGPRGCVFDVVGPSQTLCEQCDDRGTIDCSNGYCQCKENVEGVRCNECREGTFDLSKDNRQGCSECFCSGVSRTCYSSNLYREQMGVFLIADRVALTDHEGEIRVSEEIPVDIERNEASYQLVDQRTHFWRLPDKLLGNQVKSYGGNLQFVVESEGYGDYVPDQDVILRGNGKTLAWSRPPSQEQETSVTVKIHETANWQRIERTGARPATRHDFLTVLSNLEQILIRATLKSPTTMSRIRDIILDTSVPEGSIPAPDVEMCRCPAGYSGTSCETCDVFHFRNVSDVNVAFGSCTRCPCNSAGSESCSMSNEQVQCNCRPGYSGDRCEYSGPITDRPPAPPPVTISVTISSPLIQIVEVGQSVSLDCSGQVIATRIPLTVQWMKLGGNLPERSYEDRGRLYMDNLQEHDSGVYVCQARRGQEVAEQKVTVTVGSPQLTLPRVSIEPSSQTFPEGRPAVLYCVVSGKPEPIVTWTKVNGELSADTRQVGSYLNFDTITRLDEGTYQCAVQNSVGSNEALVQVFVTGLPPPTPPPSQPVEVFIQPPSFYGRVGDEVQLLCQIRSNEQVIYTWRKDNSDIYQGHIIVRGNSLSIPGAMSRDSGEYLCTATNPSTGQSSYARSQVVIEDNLPSAAPPKIKPLVEDYNIVQGQDFTITCEASGTPYPTIKWTRLRDALDSNIQQTGNTLRFMNTQPDNRGVYICIAESPGGSDQSSTRIEVEPRERPVLELHPVEPQKIRIGESAMLSCRAIAGIPEPRISWKRIDGRPMPQSMKELYPGTIQFTEITADDSGEYECSAENVAGRATATTMIIAQESPKIELDPPDETLHLTEGDEMKLICKASGSPTPNVIWSWDQPETRLSAVSQTENVAESILQAYQVSMNDAQLYTCTATNEAGTDRRYINVIVKRRRGDTGIYDIDSPATPSPSGYRPPYQPQQPPPRQPPYETPYQPPQQPPSRQPPYETPYQPQQPPSRQPPYETPYQPQQPPSRQPPYETPYQPQQPPARQPPYSPPRQPNPEYPNISTNLQPYKVGVGDRAVLLCNIEGSDAMTVWSRADGRPMPRNHVITKDSLIITDINDDAAGLYQCSVIDRFGQRPLVTAELIVVNIPRITFSPSMPMIVRTGENVAIFCNATGEQPIHVQWHAENQRPLPPSVIVDGYHLRFNRIAPADAGRYFCSASNVHGNATKVAEVLVNRGTIVDRPPSSHTQEVYEGDSVSLKCDIPSDRYEPGMRFNWRFNDRQLNGGVDISNATLILRGVSHYNTGRYTCELISQNGDIISQNYVNVVLKSPEAPTQAPTMRLNPPRAYIRAGESTVVECISQPSDFDSINWERDDGQPLPIHIRRDGNKLYIDNSEESDSGKYICRSTTPQNQEYSAIYELDVKPPTEEIYKRKPRQSEVQHAEVGSTVTLRCDAKAYPAVFKWSRTHGKFNPGQDTSASTLNLTNVQAKDAGSYICTVSSNGQSSDIATTLVVTGAIPYFPQAPKSYMVFPTLQNAYMRFNFEITFRPARENGLILYNGQKKGSGDYIALSLNDRYPEFRFDFGQKPTIVRSEEPIELGEWHTIKVNRVRKDGFMVVDNQRPVAFPPAAQFAGLDLIGNMYLSGVPEWEEVPESAVTKQEGFVGCISRLVLRDKTVELNQEAIYKEGTTSCEPCADDPCQNDGVCLESQTETGYSCICQDGFTGKNCALEGSSCAPGICGIGRCENTDIGMECYCPLNRTGDHCQYIEHLDEGSLSFKDGSYAAYRTPKATKLDIKFQLRPDNVEDSVILYVAESDSASGDFVALIIKDKHLEWRLYMSAHLKPLIIRSLSPITPNKWTSIHIGRKLGEGYLEVGNDPIQTGRAKGPARSMYLKTNLYIGGYDKRINLNKYAGATKGFEGCISKLEEGSESIDLIAHILDAANVQNCGESNEITNQPSPDEVHIPDRKDDVCAQEPCENGGTCTPSGSEFKCQCALGFAGKTCEKFIRIDQSAQFHGDGYIELNRSAFSNSTEQENYFVAVLFSTTEPNGVLLWYGQEKGAEFNGQDFLALAVVDGFLEYSYRLDSEEATTRNSDVRVDDGQRHVAIIRRSGNRAELESDYVTYYGETRPSPRTTTRLPGNLFIGGAPDLEKFTGNRFTHGFIGCIRVVENEHDGPTNLKQRAISAVNVDECPDDGEMDLGTEPPVV